MERARRSCHREKTAMPAIRRTIAVIASAVSLVAVVVTTTPIALAAPGPAPASPAASPEHGPAAVAAVPLRDLVAALPVATEVRDGYVRAKFKHWVDADRDGCNTRAEVLLAEASTPPMTGPRCSITAAPGIRPTTTATRSRPRPATSTTWFPSQKLGTSGASTWAPHRREAYANDLDEPRALLAVTAATNRSKADQDPREWLPPFEPAHCGYITDWTVVKTRWALSVDPAELTTLTELANRCPSTPIAVTPASVFLEWDLG